MFTSHTTETDWEWADKRRSIFKTPIPGALGGVATFFVGILLRGVFGDPNWLVTSFFAGFGAVIVALGLPKAETAVIWFRHKIRLDDAPSVSPNIPSAAPVPAPATSAPAVPDRPRAEVKFTCDKTGWARLQVTNTGGGAEFTATIQLDGLMAGKVEGRQLYAKWELDDEPRQWLAAGQTQTVRLASKHFIGNVVEVRERLGAWTVHQARGKDIEGVEAAEILDVTIVAKPDLVEPCRLQVLLDADGTSKMARVGIDPPLERDVPQRVTDMRRLLIEVADYVRDMDAEGGGVVWRAVTANIKVAMFISDALNWRWAAVYADAMQRDPGHPEKTCVAFLIERANRLSEEDINPAFPLPMTWKVYYEMHPDWEWPPPKA